MSTHSFALSKEPVPHYYSGSGTFRIYGITRKPLCTGGVQDILYAPDTQLTYGLTVSGLTTEPGLDIPGSHWLPKSNLSNSGANYTTGASASPLSRCFVVTILLHMLPSWTGVLFREVGKLSQLVTGLPPFSTHNPWGCPRNALLAPLTNWGISPVL